MCKRRGIHGPIVCVYLRTHAACRPVGANLPPPAFRPSLPPSNPSSLPPFFFCFCVRFVTSRSRRVVPSRAKSLATHSECCQKLRFPLAPDHPSAYRRSRHCVFGFFSCYHYCLPRPSCCIRKSPLLPPSTPRHGPGPSHSKPATLVSATSPASLSTTSSPRPATTAAYPSPIHRVLCARYSPAHASTLSWIGAFRLLSCCLRLSAAIWA